MIVFKGFTDLNIYGVKRKGTVIGDGHVAEFGVDFVELFIVFERGVEVDGEREE